ncbi:glutamate formimidoyltransferase [Coprothermobacter platensis]|uniref:glutamate formimidoyltransferase n=1 Tax=Coprothermobacter platensis TaxID=108819 RepID=UPI000477B414|nr:glutamate formimidoyltransferase [Coprothermobacter platensis]
MTLIECVPNFSEGRRQDVMDAIVDGIKAGGNVIVLDVEADQSHNRMVVTMVGEPHEVLSAMKAGAKKAVELIDLNQHHGEHPRIGAVDVVPFVPLFNATMEQCSNLAMEFGKWMWEELHVPVYLYAETARIPERKRLPNIRKGEFEGLRVCIGDPDRCPDIGEPVIHPTAGATAVGARNFLIAFNLYLNTQDKSIADRIAKAVRESSGGLTNVQAKGMFIEQKGLAQVSMNILDFSKTPLYRVTEMVKMEAEKYGVKVVEGELIGLMPLGATLNSLSYYLQIPKLTAEQILDVAVLSRLAENESEQ